ncbi:hypothetical protein BU15DRAFT_78366 [Melanogaster broomeanus]|nr:hypothetical protein BU15DRAFT_78366 [Melanogaster broomeanus]
MEEDEATMLLKIYLICRTMLDPTIVLPPRTLTQDLKRTPHRLRNDPEASKAYELDLKESETTCPSDDPSSLSDPLLLLQNTVLLISLDVLKEPPLSMSRDRNPSPRGRSLNDVLLTPPRLASTTMNRRRAPRRSSTAPSQFGNPMNLPRARRFPVPRNDLPSNRDELFELVVQTTTSALMQNLRIEELLPILRQSRDHRARNTSAVIADVTQLLERDLLALVGLSEAITRIPTTPPVKIPTMKEPRVLAVPVQHSFAPAHVSNVSPLDTYVSTVVGINVPCVTPPARDTSPDSALFVSPATDVAPDEHLLIESDPRPSPQIPEENPDLDILIDSRTLTLPVLVSTVE